MTAATATAKALSREVASAGVTVNTVQPGYILTERNSGAFREHAAAHGMGHQEAIAEAGEAIPAGRLGQVAEFGPLCAFLCSDRARYITGQSIGVDGGLVRCLQ
jgi:3-oxoacyl-[acyl-carrier protein] reductase